MASQTKHSIVHALTMEEILNSTKQACELAQSLGPKLANMANQPNMLLSSIDGVVKAFEGARERLLVMMSQQGPSMAPSSFASMLTHDDTHVSASSMQDLMGPGTYASSVDQLLLMQQQFLLENKNMVSVGGGDVQDLRYRGTLKIGEIGVKDVESADKSKGSEGEMQGMEASPSRPRKRKNELKKRTILVPAPQVGNTEMPPDDGFTWRKYGQKEILGTKYPRAYYRCTHQKLYACPAKKQVQRLDENPNIFEITYRGEHICHKSSTAPSSFPSPQLLVDISKDNITQTQSTNTISPQLSPSSTSVSTWLSTVNLSLQSGGGGSSGVGSSGGGAAAASTSKYGAENYLVADMADVMFNSGSSSANSMESLFPPNEDKWEAGEKKS